MDDHEIQSTVESILGPGVKVVDCEKKSTMREEEVLLINGVPIPLEGPDGVAIREAMITGQVPPCDLLNQILVKAGILRYRRGSFSRNKSAIAIAIARVYPLSCHLLASCTEYNIHTCMHTEWVVTVYKTNVGESFRWKGFRDRLHA